VIHEAAVGVLSAGVASSPQAKFGFTDRWVVFRLVRRPKQLFICAFMQYSGPNVNL